MQAVFILLSSPLVGPSTWRTTADAIARRGHRAQVVDLRDVVAPAGPNLVAASEGVAAAAGGAAAVLVPHSGAGPLTPWLAARVPSVVGTIFVDAGLPPVGVTDVPLAPPAFLDHLGTLAGPDGMLPPWASWWGDDAMAEVVPDAALRARLEAEMRSLPLGYFRSSVPVPPGWPGVPGAYLAFGGEAYADDIVRAGSFGWPVEVLPGAGHLHPAVAPEEVADAIAALAIAVAD